jgi:hypothetical protein
MIRSVLAFIFVWFAALLVASPTSPAQSGPIRPLNDTASQVPDTAQEPPTPPRNPMTRCTLGGSAVRIPTKTAGPEGIPVQISPPTKARYPVGAPIVVHVNSGPAPLDQARLCLKDSGFVDVSVQCVGSDGRSREPEVCREVLADVLAFATGRRQSIDNKSIEAYVAPVKALTSNVGVVAWSAGGNLATRTMFEYGDRFRDLAWYASWESPMLSTVDGGWGGVFQANRFYDAATGTVDFARLRYDTSMPLWVWPPTGLRADASWPRGGLYLDGDGDGVFRRDADYAFWIEYASPNPNEPRKAFYTASVIREARDRKVFGEVWPAHVATVEEVDKREARFAVLPHLRDVVQRLPQLAVMVFESERGHVTDGAGHPHALAQVNTWLDAGARWVRLNPDFHYVEAAMGRPPSGAVQNPAGRKLDRRGIANLVEPEADAGGPTDVEGMTAAACELADRTQTKTWTPTLTKPLVQRTK